MAKGNFSLIEKVNLHCGGVSVSVLESLPPLAPRTASEELNVKNKRGHPTNIMNNKPRKCNHQ
jgi:hypothetical protein